MADWLDILRKAVRVEGSQKAAGSKIGYDKSTVCQVLNGTYSGSTDAIEKAVLKVYGGKDMTEEQIHEGYKKRYDGALIPISAIKEIDLDRDDLVEEIIKKARSLSGVLNDFKSKALGDIEAFVALSAEKYNAKLGGRKGNVTLTSFDGKYRIIRAVSDLLECDERLQAAKALIDECIKKWTEGSRDEVKALIDQAFQPDRTGRVNAKRIMALRRLKISDPKWLTAMEAAADSIQINGSRTYLRIYERIGESDQYRQINLDAATVSGVSE